MTEVEEVDQSDHRLDNEINVSEELSMNEMCEQSDDKLKSRPFVCGINGCDKRYSKKDSLLTHQKLNHKNPIIVCTQPGCDYKTRNQYIMKRHKSVHSSHKPFRNNVPKERSKNEMCELSEEELKSRPFVCGINGCDKRYSKSKSLDSHQRLVHNNPILICSHPDCGYETRNKCQMKYHKSVHLAERPFKCTVDGCGKSAISQQNLNSHMTIVHSIGRNFKCTHDGCDSAFKCQTSLNGHYRAKHGEKRLTCSWPGCDYRCVSSNTLVLHRRVHSDERQFACDWPKCQYKSKWSNTLNKHKKSVHLKEKPYSCHWPGCEYTGTRKNFRRHYKSHSTERNYVCDYPNCGKAFVTQEYLKEHSKCHLSVKPLVCQYPDCEYRSAFRSNLYNHNKRYHK